MSDFKHPDIEKAELLLRSVLNNQLGVIYIPDMPDRSGKLNRWFQVVFAVGPGEKEILRTEVHMLFPRLLIALSKVRLETDADLISLRARRFVPESNLDPAHPVMFIEAEWAASAFRKLRQEENFALWSKECASYHNHFDRNDPLSKQYSA